MPYRAVVFKEINQHKVPVYIVAGSTAAPQKAKKALKHAFETHGGICFYCKSEIVDDFTIDHADPISLSGDDNIQNLLVAHKKCNQDKGNKAIEQFHADAGREWLNAVRAKISERLSRIP